jgi:hypothetical protein
MTEADLPEPTPGAQRVIQENGHMIEITTTVETGFHSGRARYRLECIDCGDIHSAAVLHEATTGPIELVNQHVQNRPRNWPEGLDWNNTGRWAVVTLIAGSSGNGWTVYPSVSVSRWESSEHAKREAADRRKEGTVFAAVLDWGDDLKGLVGGRLLSVPRIRAALEAQGVSFQES